MARKAFVCGSNSSREFGLLRFAVSDSEKVAGCLQGARCGFEVISPRQEDSKFALLEKLENAAYSCKAGDTFLCYFSGHGELDEGELYLIWDGRERDLLRAAVPVSAVLHALRRCQASNKLLILDCCHAGGAVRLKGVGTPFKEVVKSENHRLLMAAPRLKPVPELDEFGGSLFSVYLCQALGEKLDEASGGQGRLSVEAAKEWIERQIVDANGNLPRKKQVPYPILYGEQAGSTFFLSQEGPQWTPHLLDSPDGSRLVVLPLRSMRYPNALVSNGVTIAGQCVLCMARDPVTNEQYRRFVGATGRSKPTGQRLQAAPPASGMRFVPNSWDKGFSPWDCADFNAPEQPVVCVSHEDASAYCHWINRSLLPAQAGGRRNWRAFVPTPRLWDFAAFGTEHPAPNDPRAWLSASPEMHQGARQPAPIEAGAARCNARGLSDMIGQVWEWCSADVSYYASGMMSFQGAPRLRGLGFADDIAPDEEGFRVPFLDSAVFPEGEKMRHFDLGFRVAAMVFCDDLPADTQQQLASCKEASTYLWGGCHKQWMAAPPPPASPAKR